jgi:hypothetical protein
VIFLASALARSRVYRYSLSLPEPNTTSFSPLTATLKQKHKQPSKALDLRRKESYHGGATFWSPRKMREARAREVEKQQQEEAEIAIKANRKELQAAAKLLKEQEKKEPRVMREEQKVVRERERAVSW